jgi:hypothetical protein
MKAIKSTLKDCLTVVAYDFKTDVAADVAKFSVITVTCANFIVFTLGKVFVLLCVNALQHIASFHSSSPLCCWCGNYTMALNLRQYDAENKSAWGKIYPCG